MPTFPTPQPIAVTLELAVADVHIVAGDRTDTIVEVRPRDAAKPADVTAAQQTRVEYADGRLLIKSPKGWRQYSLRSGGEIDVQIDLPTGSHLKGAAGVADLTSTGTLGECTFKSGAGDVHLAHTGPLGIKTAAGDVAVDHVVGDAAVVTASGTVRLNHVDGAAVVKSSNGDTSIGDVTGEVRAVSANGKILVGQAQASVVAKTANGDIRVGVVARGAVIAHTARGKVDIGVRDGVAAWLDLDTKFGKVRNELDPTGKPADGEATVEIQAHTAFGDITIRRSQMEASPRA